MQAIEQPGAQLLPVAPRRRSRAPVVLALLLVPAVAPLTLARALGGDLPTPVPQLAALAPWAIGGWAGAVLLLAVARRRLLLVPLAVLALHVWWLVPPSSGPVPTAGIPLRVMTLNAEFGRADPDAIARLVTERQIDLLVVVELTRPMDDAISRAVAGRLPYAEEHSSEPGNAVGSGAWSRHPLALHPQPPQLWYTMRMTLTAPGAVPVTLSLVHTTSPMPGQTRLWRSDLAAVAEQTRATAGPELLIGDFNASRDHRPFRRILAAGLVDAADAAPGPPLPGFSWPSGSIVPPLTRIDHVLMTPGDFAARAVRTAEVPGTDHRAVIADLLVRPEGSQPPLGSRA